MVLDIILGLVDRVLEYTLAPVIRHAGFAFRYAKKVTELENQVDDLRAKRESLQNSVEEATRRGDEIQPDVKKWLTDADNALKEATGLAESEEEEAKKKCFAGGCPNLKTRYQLGKKAAKDALHIRDLEEKGKFDRSQISYRAAPQQIVSSSVHGFEGLPSRASNFKEVMDALSDPNINRIGVYGMGGAGKSTLAKEVHKQALEGNLFDVVARLDLPEKPDLKAIQTRIAEVLGLKLEEETEDGRADRLHQQLMKKRSVLIILDNLWGPIELEKLGIPLTNEKSVKGRGAHSVREGFPSNSHSKPIERKENYRNECKLLMTSRNEEVFTGGMEVQKRVKLDVLDTEESYTLFERMVGGIKDSSRQQMAKEVARKCAGLPLLLCTLAVTLKDKDIDIWQDTLKGLSDRNDEEINKKVHSVLESSYNHLPTEEVQSFFLLLGLFTYPDLPISDLLKYSMGLGLLKDVRRMEDARIRVHRLIVILKASCLLLDSETDGFVKIHDVVQDVAFSIAMRTQTAFKKAGATSKDFQRIHIKSSRIFLRDSDVFDFPRMMFRCPEIVFFHLCPKDRYFEIPDSAFEGMTKLQVLDFTDMHFSSLPPSLGSLTSLYTLCLDFCRLEDISVIRQLKNLEILSLWGSQIVDLPRDLAQLTRLKMLDLSGCSELEFIPENLLSQLSLLEELLIGDNSFVNWDVKRPDNQSNASLSELEHLSLLTNLEIHVPDAKKLPMRLFSKGLKRYKILIGEKWDWDGKYKTSKTLKLKLNTSIHGKHGVKTLLKDVEDLYLDEMTGIANVLYDLHTEGFLQLKHLHVQNSGEIRHIMDSQRRVHRSAFPVLESLSLHNLVNLEKICRGNLMAEDFRKLGIVRVIGCNRLKNLFPFSMVRRNLQQLREMEIMDCSDMEVIFVDESEEEEGEDKNEAVEFTQLNSLKLRLPHLRSFCSKVRESPASISRSHLRQNQSASDPPFKEIVSASDTSFPIFNGKIVFPNLKIMYLSSIEVDKIWNDQFGDSFRKLTSLTVEACGNLNYLFTSSTLKILAQLQKLEIRRCNLMESVIATEGEIIGEAAFPNLEYLQLEGLPKLSTFCTGDLIEFPNLKELRIGNCPALKAFVSDPVAVNTGSELALFDEKVAFPKLEELRVVGMDGLKMIWHTELHECSFRKLKSMIVERANELLNIFPSAMLMSRLLNLENLELDDCALLEEVFNLQVQGLKNSTTQGLPASRLRTLRIRDMPNLKLIWNKHPQDREIISFNDLQVVEAYDCPNLKSVFSASIARGLLQLEDVDLGICGIEEIVGRDEGTEAIARFEFPKLTTLRLYCLRELKRLYPGVHTCLWPKLKTLDVRDCPNIELFTSESSGSVQETCRGSQLDNPSPQPFFSVEKGIPPLEQLTLGSNDARMIRAARIPEHFFYEVRCLRLEGPDENSASISLDLLRRFPELETLQISDNDRLEEMFSWEGSVGGENQGSIWRGDCQLERTFEHIETLEVSACPSLISLAPSIASLGNLSHLDVWDCNGLLNLLTSSTAQCMRHLTTLRVTECDLVEEIVAREEDDREDRITWDNLKSLQLDRLGSLTCFSSACHTFQFPSLEEVIVTGCPKMKTFSGGISITPKLKGVKVESGDAEGRWEGDLNTTIQKLCADLAGQLRGINHLKLSEFPELKEIWTKENFPANVLSQLWSLVVDECVYNSNAVPSNLLRSLDNLRWLEVKNCDSVEEVFDLTAPNASDGQIKTLPMLYELQLIDLPRLKQVWKEDPNGVFHLRSLKELKIHNCSTLRYLFTPTTCLGLVHLQELEVKSCPLIEEIITKGAASGSTVDNIMFPQLNSVSLECLPNLASFYSGSGTVQCASLKIINIIECSSTFSSAFLNECPPFNTNGAIQPKIVFPNLEELKLSSIGVENTWSGQFVDQSSLFSRLTNLAVEGCGNLNYLLSPTAAKSLSQLQQLKICDCKSMEEVVVPEGEMLRKMLFPRLKFLQLKGLPKLVRFCLGDEIEFPCLEELWIENCLELKTFISNHFTASTAAILALFDGKVALPMLTTLQVLNLDRLKMIWHNELHKESFCKLKNLTVKHCRELSKIFPSIMLTRFQDLEQLDVRDCDSLEEVFNLQVLMDIKETHEEMVTQLRTVYLGNLPNLKHIWKENRQINISFRSLCLAHVWDCPLLKSIFPASIAEGLLQLEDLNIDSCGVEEIVAVEGAEGKEAPITRFMFPKLNSLTLWKLSKLDKFYPGIHTTEWPALKTLNVKRCDKMKIFSFESHSWQGPCEEEQPDIQVLQPLFSFQEVVPGLEELSLNNEDATMIWKIQFPANLFDKVRALQLNCFHDQSTVSPFECLHRFRNVEKLLVACSQFKELFASEELFDKEEHKRALAQIRHLKLDCLPDLEHIWNQESQPDHVLPRLSTLEVLNCDNLRNLAPSYASFRSLTALEMKKCHGLINIVASSTAKTLVHLRTMKIIECNVVIEIVASDGWKTEEEIMFRKLVTLELNCLPSLTSFCSANHSFKFPSLTEVIVSQCPKMEFFSKGALIASELERVGRTGEDYEGCWHRNLNATIQQLFTERNKHN